MIGPKKERHRASGLHADARGYGGPLLALLAAVMLVGCRDAAGAIPKPAGPVFSDIIGVSTHHAQIDDLDMMQAAGIRIVRLDLRWQATEVRRGVYVWTGYLEWAEELARRKMRPMLVLDYGNPLYSSGSSGTSPWAPRTEAERRAFSNWAAAAAKAFAPYDPIWEIWNEPEFDGFWPPKSNSGAYFALAAETCHAMRSVVPRAVIVGPAAANVPKPLSRRPAFLVDFLRTSGARCLSGVSVHPYLKISEMGFTPILWRELRVMIAQSIPEPRPFVLSSEWGLSTTEVKGDERFQAAYLVKLTVLNAAAGIPVSIWYDWRDDGPDPANIQHNYGLVRQNGQPKQSLLALKTLTHVLGGYRFARKLDVRGATILVFEKPDSKQKVAVAWANAPRSRIVWAPGIKSPYAIDTNGVPVVHQNINTIELSSEPILVSF